ncbi:type II secretion system protein [Armatimonas sp.]|uniref:type II secretion system protein n=1 Tax=Armatimonas sp. TaxID=1872638 RepID=UPI00286AEA19|nr:type II secretion system protein [Armatimonas sp.]
MSQPSPRYEPPRPRFQLKASLTEILVCLAIVGILYAILFPIFAQPRERASQSYCLSNGKQLSLAVMMYSQDYDEYLPLATNWYDASYPYRKNRLRCPRLSDPNGIGYAMDERLSGRSLDKIGAPHDKSPLLYESSNFTPNAHDAVTSFAGRHTNQTGWVGFVDGHVKMLQKANYPPCK